MRAFRARRQFDTTRAGARGRLYGIASNLIADHARGEARGYRAMARSVEPADHASHDDQVAGRVSAAVMQPKPAAALAELSAGDRDVLLHGDQDGARCPDIDLFAPFMRNATFVHSLVPL